MVAHSNSRAKGGSPFSKSKMNNAYSTFSSVCREYGLVMIIARPESLRGNMVSFGWIWEGRWKSVKNKRVMLVFDKMKNNEEYFRKKRIISKKMKMINDPEFSIIADDKFLTYSYFKKYLPKAVLPLRQRLEKQLDSLGRNKFVVKPRFGSYGMGVMILDRESVLKLTDRELKNQIIQEFIDTSKGVPGMINGPNTLRVSVINGQIMEVHFRKPKKGIIIAKHTVASPVETNELPENVKNILDLVDRRFSRFSPRFYSVDFLIDGSGKAWIGEINSKPGIFYSPGESKKSYLKIYRKLAEVIKEQLTKQTRASQSIPS